MHLLSPHKDLVSWSPCSFFFLKIQNEHGDLMTRSSNETSFIVAYVYCVLKVNANEVFPDQEKIFHSLRKRVTVAVVELRK